jgi:hypothetical protein
MLHILFLVLKALMAYFGVGFVSGAIWLWLGRNSDSSSVPGGALALFIAWPIMIPFLIISGSWVLIEEVMMKWDERRDRLRRAKERT